MNTEEAAVHLATYYAILKGYISGLAGDDALDALNEKVVNHGPVLERTIHATGTEYSRIVIEECNSDDGSWLEINQACLGDGMPLTIDDDNIDFVIRVLTGWQHRAR